MNNQTTSTQWHHLAGLPALEDMRADVHLSRKQVAALLGVAPYTLSRLAKKGGDEGPPFITIGERSHRYVVKQLRIWLTDKGWEEYEQRTSLALSRPTNIDSSTTKETV